MPFDSSFVLGGAIAVVTPGEEDDVESPVDVEPVPQPDDDVSS